MEVTDNHIERKRILVVEDEESNYELLKAMLRKREVDVLWAQTGLRAVEMCDKHDFHLILMDIKMPELSGYEALYILRDKGVKIPIVAQTAYARLEDESKALAAGFDGYISKPIDRNKLFEIINTFFL